ncbi:hypothetical protein D3C86_1655650 [compost metagenome]
MSFRSDIHAFTVNVNKDWPVIEFGINSSKHGSDHEILFHFVLHSGEHDFRSGFAHIIVTAEVNLPAILIVRSVTLVVFVGTDENTQDLWVRPLVSDEFRLENICLTSCFPV